MARPLAFRQGDVARALKAAKSAGITVARYEIDAEGKIVVFAGEPTSASMQTDPLDEWKARRDARRAQRRAHD